MPCICIFVERDDGLNKSPEGGLVQAASCRDRDMVCGTFQLPGGGPGQDKGRRIPWRPDSGARFWDEAAKAAE
jgi:hypothetical protein